MLSDFHSANLLLTALGDDDMAMLQPHFTRVEVARDQFLAAADTPIEHVYFLEGGIASVVSTSPYVGRTEVGIFGRDGFSGLAVLEDRRATGTPVAG